MNYQTITMAGDAQDHVGGRTPAPSPSRAAGDAGDDANLFHDHNATVSTKRSPVTSAQSFTPRSLLVGLIIGSLITFSNTYFGLQTGWISTMAMPSSLIGFAVFKVLSRHLSFPFNPIENVLIQTVAGAVGTMPLGCGFVGVIPALESLLRKGDDGPAGDGGEGEGGPLKVGFWKLVVWSLGVCLFGVVFAVPLRKEVIIREKLKFPSGTATALMIRVLHGSGKSDEKGMERQGESMETEQEAETERLLTARESEERGSLFKQGLVESRADGRKDWKAKIRLLVGAFAVSAFYTLFSYFVPQIRDIPILGFPLAFKWLWTLNPSPAYVGQGIIMGPSTSMHMLFGAILGWGILSPLARKRGWAPGPVDDWENGSKGWIVWVSLAIMLADSIINLSWLVIKPLVKHAPELRSMLRSTRRNGWSWRKLFRSGPRSYAGYSVLTPISEASRGASSHHFHSAPAEGDEEDAPPSQLISMRTVVILLPLTLVLNVVCMHIAFGNVITPLLSSVATLLALFLSIMGVRALGETDLNPVSGISKLTQLLFSLVTPASQHTRRTAIVTNLLAGAVSEAGALQAGDMMQDLKTGHLLGASPKAQFYGQLIGSLFGAVISTAVYKMYIKVYEVPGPMFQTPTAYVWIFTARLVTGQGLPPMAWRAAIVAGVVFVVLTVLRIVGSTTVNGRAVSSPWRAWIPGGIAVAVGMYNVPSFTLARAIGGVIAWWWGWKNNAGRRRRRSLSISQHHSTVANSYSRIAIASDDPAGSSGSSGQEVMERDDGIDDHDEDAQDESSSTLVVLASGLILGEGVVSIINLILASAGVPHL